MASLTLMLHLLLLLSAVSASRSRDYYRYMGSSLTFDSKQNTDGTYEVQFNNRQTHRNCYYNRYTVNLGNYGSRIRTDVTQIGRNSYGFTWCEYEVKAKRRLSSNRPFEIRYPTYYNSYYGYGYWERNFRSSYPALRVVAHVDLGTRSDTHEANKSPKFTMVPIIRVTRNCPRSFNMTVYDPDGDHVRCRVPTNRNTYECGLCGLTSGLTFDQNSCSLRYTASGRTGYHPVELMVEDFSNEEITLSYSDGYHTLKRPYGAQARRRRDTGSFSTTTETFTTVAPPTTPAAPPTTPAAPPTTTTAAWTTTTAAWTTTTAAPTTTTVAPTTTAAPTTTTAAWTTTAVWTTTLSPTTTTAAPTTTTLAPTTTTLAPTTTTLAPTTTTAAPTTTTAAPTTTTLAPTTTTLAPTTTTAAPTTTTPVPTTTTAAPTTTTAEPTTTERPPISSIAPLSKLPLQFSIFVDSHNAPSCVDGDYFPIFLAPTPRNGVNLPGWLNQTLEIKVISTARFARINDLIVTGPKGLTKARTDTDEYVIRWTPRDDHVDNHFPICFVSEARDRNNRIYHSELRCVTVDVGHQEATVTCNATTMTVEVVKSYLIRRNEHNLHLNEYTGPACNLSMLSNNTHMVAVMSLSSCGTRVEEDDNNIIYKNDITSADPNEIISRKHDVDIAIFCAYPKRTNLTLGFTHKNPYAFSEKGFGSFTYRFEFFETQRFRTQVDASSYPVEVYLKQMIFMQIEATTSIPNTELFVESCRATPNDNPNSRITYTIIENGCVRDNTVEVYPSSRTQFRFGMEAFEFIGAHEEVYITCSVLLCETGVPGTRCSRGCIRSGNHRSRRAAAAESSQHSISQGPLHLIQPSDSRVSGSNLNLILNVVFIVGCLVAVTVAIYRSKRSRAKYQRLPTSDVE